MSVQLIAMGILGVVLGCLGTLLGLAFSRWADEAERAGAHKRGPCACGRCRPANIASVVNRLREPRCSSTSAQECRCPRCLLIVANAKRLELGYPPLERLPFGEDAAAGEKPEGGAA